ncbi:MAG TPA: hypothetical protein P5528_14255, partial [Steroidobacteraceae bacterium]|nr:hypothetical protein [Steroidobacteraceae bacterium]
HDNHDPIDGVSFDQRLDESLGEFDATLQKEQERVARERDAQAAAGGTSNDDPGSATADDRNVLTASTGKRPGDLRSDRSGGSSESGGSERSGGSSGGAAAGAGGAGGGGAAPVNVPDGSDDDIVARRLRRAAERETDPELKEKLWKEYTEYKRNTQGRS